MTSFKPPYSWPFQQKMYGLPSSANAQKSEFLIAQPDGTMAFGSYVAATNNVGKEFTESKLRPSFIFIFQAPHSNHTKPVYISATYGWGDGAKHWAKVWDEEPSSSLMHWVIVRPFSRLLVPDAGGLPQSGILWPPPNPPTLEFYFKIDTNVNTHNVFGGVEEFQRHEIKFSIPKKQAMLGNSTVGADLQANQWVALQLGVSVFQKLDAFDLEVESYVGGSMILRGLQVW